MKKIFALLMIVFFVFIFSSCGSSEPAVVGSDDTTAESTTIAENTTNNNIENNKETTDPKNTVETTDSVESTKETENSTSSKTETTASEKVQQETTAAKPETDKVVIEDDEIIAPAYRLVIPEDFEVKTDGENPLLENKRGTVQFNIMDKTDSVTDFEKYVSDTYNSAVVVGMATGEVETVTIADVQMKRFAMIMKDDDGEELDSYAYLAQVNGRVLLITLTSKDGALADVSAADSFVESIEF